ncbi:MAG TPA: molybdopterin-dependent oxidoreductase [Dehalococcoidia bacterium]|jgi:anaerobic dimethyl sulfoxide reductase subunit A|nr:molybdopterin-dependent oxidoreductase [Dehalococcoidia bacterium]
MSQGDTKVVATTCIHDCGGRCRLKVHVKDGVVTRIENWGDEEEPWYRGCLRGRAFRQWLYSPDRLRYPMKRVGERGQGKFERISWDEALDTTARELRRIIDTYGNSAILFFGLGGGSNGALHGRRSAYRLLNMLGGCTTTWGMISNQGAIVSSLVTYGDMNTGNSREDHLNSRLIILWGWNPADSIWDSGTSLHLALAREAGARVVCVDPRFSNTAAALSQQWIPIRPGTDTAMLIAMAYVILKNGLEDRKFINTYSLGFERYEDYVLGREDGIEKTPAWAEAITGVPATTIEGLAREYATSKPAALLTGWAPGRTAYGEQFHRAAAALATMTGNVGIHGGNATGWEGVIPACGWSGGSPPARTLWTWLSHPGPRPSR